MKVVTEVTLVTVVIVVTKKLQGKLTVMNVFLWEKKNGFEKLGNDKKKDWKY